MGKKVMYNLSLFIIAIALISCASNSQKIIYVNDDASNRGDGKSWSSAYNNLQDALDKAVPGYEIWVAAGTYIPQKTVGGPEERKESFQLKNGVVLYGGFVGNETKFDERNWERNKTILSGDLKNNDAENIYDDNSYHVVHGNGTDSTAVIDGFIITGGNANFDVWPDDGGGGMNNHNGSPTIKNCTFKSNKAYADGGGMRNWGENSKPTIVNCTFIKNSATQEGGGMMNGPGSKPTVISCRFFNNSAGEDGGGMYNNESFDSIIANCVFKSNYASLTGGGMYNVNSSSPNVINCTFSENSAQKAGGAVYNNNGFPTITNSILWGNSAPTSNELHNFELSRSIVSYCVIDGGYEGTGNIDKDPLFGDENLRLLGGSPCIDRGDNNAVPNWLNKDAFGNSRLINDIVDIGAYEYKSNH